MNVREEPDFKPTCPHCECSIREIVAVKHGSVKQHVVYCCPQCRKIIGIGVDRAS